MQRLHYSIFIPASRQKVWDALIGKTTYPQWTESFCPGSDVEGEWKEGARLHFIGPNPHGEVDGMFSEVALLRENEYISIHHLGVIQKGVEVQDTPMAKDWKDAYENYTLTEEGEGTLFEVDIDLEDTWTSYFNETWPKALERLKEVVLKGQSTSVSVYTWIRGTTDLVWDCYTKGEHMRGWNFADITWECPHATVDLRAGGSFSARMQAKDGSFGFDFAGEYTKVEAPTSLSYRMEDGRTVDVDFTQEEEYVRAVVRFDIEHENPREMQRQGWQMILDNFKKYVEEKKVS